jgi:hypothetical protein
MKNVTGRKMFRSNAARDKLRQAGGIMSSSQELMEAVQKFSNGGGVRSSYVPGLGYQTPTLPSQIARANQAQINLRRAQRAAGGIPDVPPTFGQSTYTTPTGIFDAQALKNIRNFPALMAQQVSAAYQRNLGPEADTALTRAGDSIRDFLRVKPAPTLGQFVTDFDQDPTGQPLADVPDTALVPKPKTTGATDDAGYLGDEPDLLAPPLTNLSAGNMTAERIARAKAITSGELTSSPEDVSAIPQIAPTREELEAKLAAQDEKDQQGLQQGSQSNVDLSNVPDNLDTGDTLSDVADASGIEQEKQRIEEIVNSDDKDLQQGELNRLIREFKENAPEYKGTSKGLAIAKIGFAMAAGQSPNAITNIANALNQGADMLIKDQKDKDAFNRQVDLSALQYGLKEVGAKRREARAAKEKGLTPNFFVATKNGTLPNGKKYFKDQNFMMTTEEIREFGLPEGALIPSTFKTMKDNETATLKAAAKAAQDGVMGSKEYLEVTDRVQEASDLFYDVNSMRELVERNIIRNAKGEITGFNGAFNAVVGQAFAAAGVTPDKKYTSRAEYDAEMTEVANKLLPQLLSEGSKNISNIDRTLANEIVGLYKSLDGKQSVFSYATVPQTVLNGRLQRVLTKLEASERKALTKFAEAQNAVNGYTLRGGREITLNIPEGARAQLEGDTEYKPPFALVDGVYKRVQ